MFSGYIKAVGTAKMLNRNVPEEDGTLKSVAVPGFIKWQEQFFFDGRDPDSVKRAYENASRHAATRQGRLSIYGCPEMAGPWDDIPRVGRGIGEEI